MLLSKIYGNKEELYRIMMALAVKYNSNVGMLLTIFRALVKTKK